MARAVAVAFVLLGLAFASGAQESDLTAAVDAAKKEGKVTFYTSALGQPFHQEVFKAFEQKYGIAVEVLDARASELRERVRTEQTSGRYLGDVVANGAATLFRQEGEGVLQPHGGLPNAARLRADFAATPVRVPYYIHGYGILINTRLVRPPDEPRSWTDLLDPKWRGKILCDDVRAIGGGQVMFHAITDALGQAFHEKLATQGLIFSRDVGNDERRVARGEYPLRIPQTFSNYLQMKGLPVKLVIPSEGAPYIRFDLAVLRNAPHPNAARLFVDHLIGEPAQIVYASGGLIPTRAGIVEKARPDVRGFAGAKLMGTTRPETQDAMLALAREIYGK